MIFSMKNGNHSCRGGKKVDKFSYYFNFFRFLLEQNMILKYFYTLKRIYETIS